MATLKSTGGDYTSMSVWEADNQGVLTAPEILECYKGTTVNGGWQEDGSLVDTVDLNSWGTSAVNNVTIKAAAGNECLGVFGSGFVMSSASTAQTLRVSQNYAKVESIEVQNTNATAGVALAFGASINVSPSVVISDCILEGWQSAGLSFASNGLVTFNSCIHVCHKNNGSVFVAGAGNLEVNNCVVHAINGTSGNGISSSNRDPILNNCSVIGAIGGLDIATADPASTNNATQDATAQNYLNGIVGLSDVAGVDFVDAPNKIYNIVPAGLLDGNGTSPPVLVLDIAYNPFSDPSEIGPFAISGPPPVGIQEMYIKDGGIFVKYTPYVKVGGTFQEVDAYVLEGGTWKPVHEK